MARTSGPKRLPTERKKLARTHKKSRDNPTAPAPPPSRPVPPDDFDAEELEAFEIICARLDGERRLSSSHAELIALAAMRMVEIRQLRREIREAGGWTYETATDRSQQVSYRRHPAADQLNQASRGLHALLAELGLTPASVSKVGGGKEAEPTNPFHALPN